MTGDRIAHPLLLSLANLGMDFRRKGSHQAFLLLALLPIPKFLEGQSKVRGVLESRLVHEALDFVLAPLKTAAEIGIMMSDAMGSVRHMYTLPAAYMVDTPESALMSGVGGKTSSVTMATYRQFGDNFQHEPRTASTTLAQLAEIESTVDPWDLIQYIREAMKFRLNGVHRPFWRNWAMGDPSNFLTPELLHHWIKCFWDHDAKWCKRALGDAEIDFRFSILHPHTGYRHFGEGYSKLKQVTGREQREIQRYMVAVIAGAVPKDFLIAIRSLMDFRYRGQAPSIDDEACEKIQGALSEFHEHKGAILDAGVRVGKGNRPINNWHIPKLEFMQSVVPNIRANGVPMQWSADLTEHAHITEIKDPASFSNNQNYESQICRFLDRRDKSRQFGLATSLRDAELDFGGVDDGDDGNGQKCANTTASLLREIEPVASLSGPRSARNHFKEANDLLQGKKPNAPLPFRTFATDSTAFHLARDPSFKRMTVDEAAEKFGLPDLRSSLAEYMYRVAKGDGSAHTIGGRRTAANNCVLPFEKLEVWTSVRLQSKSLHTNDIGTAYAVHAAPTSEQWPSGRCDAVLINHEPQEGWPRSGMKGEELIALD